MTGPYATAVIAVSLLLAGWALVLLFANRAPNRPLWLALGALEALLLGFLAWGIVALVGRTTDFASLEFLLYLVGVAVIVPLAGWWVREEKSRAAAGVLLVALLVVPIMVVRVQQVWAGA